MNDLWYKFPVGRSDMQKSAEGAPDCWEKEALPIGNGSMGGMIYGGVESERIQFNEKTLWTGTPVRECFDAASHLPDIRRALLDGNKAKALELSEKYLIGTEESFGSYQNFGEIRICFSDGESGAIPGDYRRELSLDTAIAKVSYSQNGIRYERTAFCSYPDCVMAVRITASKPKALNFSISLISAHDGCDFSVENDNLLRMHGNLSDNGLAYEAQLKIIMEDGIAASRGNQLQVSGCTAATLILACGTDYKNEYPQYRGENPRNSVAARIEAAAAQGYESLLNRHLKDYQPLYRRVALELSEPAAQNDERPTDEMLALYPQKGSEGLEELMFRYGRYLLIAASRPNALPANLQGVWNNSNTPAWCGDYHFNINLQMNYWPAEPANLTECSDSLAAYVESLRKPGEVTAKQFFGAKSGWAVNTMNNPFGYTHPGWRFTWGWAPNSSAFICRNLWEKYAFTGDIAVLERIYPILKGAAECWSDFLSEDSDGTLVSSPSFSPEHGDCEIGCAMDQQLVYDLFTNTICAAGLLGVDEAFKELLSGQLSRLSKPNRIGSWGQLQEWKEDLDDPTDYHRHISQLVSLYPCSQITKKAPELMEAARTTLIHRGDEATGWSRAWKLCLWARLGDGNHAHHILAGQLMKCTYKNLFDTHPPFQIDGNLGYTAGVCEMLLQSHSESIVLLPALPDRWQNGRFSGLCARGGFVVSAQWKAGVVQTAFITAKQGGVCRVGLTPPCGIASVMNSDGAAVPVKATKAALSFQTEPGEEYQLIFD